MPLHRVLIMFDSRRRRLLLLRRTVTSQMFSTWPVRNPAVLGSIKPRHSKARYCEEVEAFVRDAAGTKLGPIIVIAFARASPRASSGTTDA